MYPVTAISQGLKPTHADQILTLKWLESWLDYSAEKIYTCVPVVAKSLTSKAMTVNNYIIKVQEFYHLYSRRDLIRKWTLDVNSPSCRSATKSSPICPDKIMKDLGCKTHIKIIYGAFQIHVPATSHVRHTCFWTIQMLDIIANTCQTVSMFSVRNLYTRLLECRSKFRSAVALFWL